MIGHCPVHGRQRFVRNEMLAWWRCPLAGDCWSVVLDEDVTPDGADVIQWGEEPVGSALPGRKVRGAPPAEGWAVLR